MHAYHMHAYTRIYIISADPLGSDDVRESVVIPYCLQREAAAAKPPPHPFGFYILIDVGLYVFRSVGL